VSDAQKSDYQLIMD